MPKERGGGFRELVVESGVWQATIHISVFHVLIDLLWNIKTAFSF